jgi:Rhs element Vgr protein
MSPTPNIPDPSIHGVLSYDILSDGNRVDPGHEVIAITINREVNRIPIATIVLRDGNAADETFEISNTPDFEPGKKLVIRLGRDGDNAQAFAGIITRHSIRVDENGKSNLMLECRDESIKLTIGRHSRYFEDIRDQEMIEEIISGYGLNAEVEDTSTVHRELVQQHATDWDFILSRADVNGKLVIVEDGIIHVESPKTNQEPEITLHYGQNLLEFEAGMDARSQWKKVKGTAWDFANQQLFEAETESADFAENGNIPGNVLAEAIGLSEFELRHTGHMLEEELRQWVNSGMLKSRLAKIRGRAKVREGYLGFRPGTMVSLAGVGERFEGNAYVTGVMHELRAGAWDSHIQFGLDPAWFASREEIIDFPAGGLLPGVRGLQIGIVVQLQDDPEGEDRIRVKLPVVDHQSAGIWCRVACLDAGNNRGTFFRPEIDDEVIVGFLNDDPRDAVVLGMLNSSSKPAPLTAKDENHEKGIFTRSNMRIHFEDNDKTITIDTPAGNSIKLDESGQTIEIIDQNQNSVKMGTSGIEMKSPMEIKIEAGTTLTLAAGTSLSIQAVNLTAKADGQMNLEGAVAKISASGITEVKGSLVKIN